MKLFGPPKTVARGRLVTNRPTYTQSAFVNKTMIMEGVWEPCDGYGASAENIALALDKLSDIAFYPRHKGPTIKDSHPRMKEIVTVSAKSNKYLVYLSAAPDVLTGGPPRPLNALKVLMTMFEANRVPLTWRSRIAGAFDKLIVPCNFCKNVFDAAGGFPPVEVIPLAVNTDLYTMKTRAFPSDRKFRFLFLFANHALADDRKNSLAVITAFNYAFGGNESVELIIKVSGEMHPGILNTLPSNVRIINERFSPQRIKELYYETDCFLFPSRGEGYGMPPREAMATGMPVIVTNFSGLADIADERYCYPLNDIKMVPAFYPQGEADRHNNGNPLFGEWADISIDELISQMKSVYQNYDKAIVRGQAASKYIHEYENPALTANKILKVMAIK